jgi:D-alanyl-D-alanine dipeptidase
MTRKYIRESNGMVNVADMDCSLIIDLKYATNDNFTNAAIYPINVCVLQRETALKLINANKEFKELGYRIKIWDAYRPMYVQRIFWDIVHDERFVANPNKNGSRHNRGTAVDVTLVDSLLRELKMPCEYDDFSDKAFRNYESMNDEEEKNINLLTSVMNRHGFLTIDTEWWHFDDSNYSIYEIIDVKLEDFIL